MGFDFEGGPGVVEDFYVIYVYFSGGGVDCLALAGEFVGALAVDFDGGEGGNFLGDFSDEVLSNFFDRFWAGCGA